MTHLLGPMYNADVMPAAFPWAPVSRQRVEVAITLDNRETYNAAVVARIIAARDGGGAVDVPADNDALLEWLQS